jgi:GntR family transcriptional repressor for pyruvate dehydrogenase complex
MAIELGSAPPATRPRLSEIILDYLMDKILSGALVPGDELPSETELATTFKVSKPTVRDALRHLAALGLVDIQQGRPSSVGKVSSNTLSQFFRFAMVGAPHKFRDIVAIRRSIECLAAPEAAKNINDAEIAEMGKILEDWRQCKMDYERWVVLDVSFHRLIATASRNVLLPFLMDALRGLMEDVMRVPYARNVNRDPEKTYQRHLALGNAIAAHDPKLALALMEEHFEASLAHIAAQEQAAG